MLPRPNREQFTLNKPIASQFPETDELMCIEIKLPNDLQYLYLLQGFYAQMTNYWIWSGTPEEQKRRAEICQNAYTETDWSACMNCDEMIECLLPLFLEVYEKIENLEEDMGAGFQNILNNIRYGSDQQVAPGNPPPEGQNENDAAIGTNPECDKDILWAQCTQIVEWFVGVATDTLEIAESATNDTELINALGELPIINELGIPAVAAYIDLLLEGVIENFAAQITTELKEEIACMIMQECCNDCVVNVDRLWTVASLRMQAHFIDFPTTVASIFDLWTYLTDQDIDDTTVVDMIFSLFIGGGWLANAFFSAVGIKPLETILLLAVNDANDDWLILCPDCPPPVLEAQAVAMMFEECGEGVYDETEFEPGVSFTLDAKEYGTTGTYYLALVLPVGDWNVTLVDFIGTVTPPVDLTETAYAWFDPTTGYEAVLWNTPAAPDEFGNHDTAAGYNPAWCTEQGFYVMLFNASSFSAEFIVTAI